MMLGSGMNALHEPNKAFMWSAMRLFVFTLPAAALGSHYYSVEGMFIGVAVGNVLGGVLAYLYALGVRKKHLYQAS